MLRLPIRALFAVVFIALIAGCASTRTPAEKVAVGTWNYTVYGTPEGDVDGVVTFVLEQGRLAGQIGAAVIPGTVPLEKVALEEGRLTFSAAFEMDGYPIQTETIVTLDEDKMEGNMEVSGIGTYRVQGTRQS